MEEYGLGTWDGNGVQLLGPATFTMRVVLSTLVTFTSGGGASTQSFSVPGCTPENSFAVIVPVAAYSAGNRLHQVQFEPEILNGSVRVWRGHRTAVNGLYAFGTQRLIVSRFR